MSGKRETREEMRWKSGGTERGENIERSERQREMEGRREEGVDEPRGLGEKRAV